MGSDRAVRIRGDPPTTTAAAAGSTRRLHSHRDLARPPAPHLSPRAAPVRLLPRYRNFCEMNAAFITLKSSARATIINEPSTDGLRRISITMKLVLRPSLALAEPQGWWAVGEVPSFAQRADELVCLGGGSLLLWLLFRAGKAPWAARRVSVYGALTFPTPESCGAWAASGTRRGDPTLPTRPPPDPHEWRRQATLLLSSNAGDRGSQWRPEQLWLIPLLQPTAAGRFEEVHNEMAIALDRWAASGRVTFCAAEALSAQRDAHGRCQLSMQLRASEGAERRKEGGGECVSQLCSVDDALLSTRAQCHGWYCLTP